MRQEERDREANIRGGGGVKILLYPLVITKPTPNSGGVGVRGIWEVGRGGGARPRELPSCERCAPVYTPPFPFW